MTGCDHNPIIYSKSLYVLKVLQTAILIQSDIGCHQSKLKLAANILMWCLILVTAFDEADILTDGMSWSP